MATTYSNPDYTTHVNMAVNDLCAICGSAVFGGGLNNRQWIRAVGQDLYDTHGFRAMQEVFIQVKNRYPTFQSALSEIFRKFRTHFLICKKTLIFVRNLRNISDNI